AACERRMAPGRIDVAAAGPGSKDLAGAGGARLRRPADAPRPGDPLESSRAARGRQLAVRDDPPVQEAEYVLRRRPVITLIPRGSAVRGRPGAGRGGRLSRRATSRSRLGGGGSRVGRVLPPEPPTYSPAFRAFRIRGSGSVHRLARRCEVDRTGGRPPGSPALSLDLGEDYDLGVVGRCARGGAHPARRRALAAGLPPA